MKRILLCLLCAALLTGCGKETDPAVAAAQRYQSVVQAVGDGTSAGVDLTDAQIAQAVARLSDAGLTAVHVDAADPVTHPETVTAFRDARAAGETAEIALYEVCRDGGLLCHTLRFADGTDTVTRTRVVWRDGAFSVSYADTYTVTSLMLDGGRLTYVYDMPDNPPGTDHDGHIDTQETFAVGYTAAARPKQGRAAVCYLMRGGRRMPRRSAAARPAPAAPCRRIPADSVRRDRSARTRRKAVHCQARRSHCRGQAPAR